MFSVGFTTHTNTHSHTHTHVPKSFRSPYMLSAVKNPFWKHSYPHVCAAMLAAVQELLDKREFFISKAVSMSADMQDKQLKGDEQVRNLLIVPASFCIK